MDWFPWIALFFTFISFCFSGTETALTSLGRLEIERLLTSKRPWRKMLKVWVHQPERILILILIGNNITNIIASSLMTLWAQKFYPMGISIVIGIFTFIVIFFAEVLPKIFARQFAEILAPAALSFLYWVSKPLAPATWAMEKLSRFVIWALGFDLSKSVYSPFSEEEVTQTIELATIQGGLDPETGEALSNLMEFSDHRAQDVMTPKSKVKSLHMKMSLDEVTRFIAQESFSRYPVYRDGFDDMVGTIHVKDLLNTMQRGGVMIATNWTRAIRRPYFVSEISALGEILRDMKRWGTHLALVRNETGVITGLLTLEDLIEEIVGDIRDEHDDPSDAGFEGPMGGPRVLTGETSIIDFNERFDENLPLEASYSTLNGYILKKTGGTLPPVGTLIFDGPYTFKILEVNDKGVPLFEVLEVDNRSDEDD
ncbi:MAG: hemolysin family protein [Bdellovibrionota bacterium]